MEGDDTADDRPTVPAATGSGPLGRSFSALDALVRRASGPRRAPGAGATGAPGATEATGAGRWPLWAAAVVLLVALAVGWAGWTFLARPAPIEDRMPLAGTAPADAGAGSGEGHGNGSGDGSGDGSGSGPRGEAGADGAAGGATSPSSGPGPVTLVVHVAGAVHRPGVVQLADGARVAEAVAAAGGLAAGADGDRLNLAAPVADGARVFVPAVGQEVPVEVVPRPAAPSGGNDGAQPPPDPPLDLNSAEAPDLEELPGIGPATAAAILDHRERHGPFRSVDDLLDVRGIGEAKLDALTDLVTVG